MCNEGNISERNTNTSFEKGEDYLYPCRYLSERHTHPPPFLSLHKYLEKQIDMHTKHDWSSWVAVLIIYSDPLWIIYYEFNSKSAITGKDLGMTEKKNKGKQFGLCYDKQRIISS